jgi:hypothetical protein
VRQASARRRVAADPVLVSELLGHSGIQITSDIYLACSRTSSGTPPRPQPSWCRGRRRAGCVRCVSIACPSGSGGRWRRGCPTPESAGGRWWGGWGSNPRPRDYEAERPLSLLCRRVSFMQVRTGAGCHVVTAGATACRRSCEHFVSTDSACFSVKLGSDRPPNSVDAPRVCSAQGSTWRLRRRLLRRHGHCRGRWRGWLRPRHLRDPLGDAVEDHRHDDEDEHHEGDELDHELAEGLSVATCAAPWWSWRAGPLCRPPRRGLRPERCLRAAEAQTPAG